MSTRFLLTSNPPRMIVSKQGFEASPELDDDNKCFDSNWFGGNGIKWVLRKDQYFHKQPDKPKWQGLRMTMDFPYELNYQPACIAFHCTIPSDSNGDRVIVREHYYVWNDNKSVTVTAPFGVGVFQLYLSWFLKAARHKLEPKKQRALLLGQTPMTAEKVFG